METMQNNSDQKDQERRREALSKAWRLLFDADWILVESTDVFMLPRHKSRSFPPVHRIAPEFT